MVTAPTSENTSSGLLTLVHDRVFLVAAGTSSILFSDPLVNMEICAARLSQREALIFGSGANLRRAVPKLRMIDTSTTPTEDEGVSLCHMGSGCSTAVAHTPVEQNS